jgi:alpha-L-fucosidase
LQTAFNWNPHGQNALKNLSLDYQIYYSLDGSQPGITSLRYDGPFQMAPGEIKAVAIGKNGAGAIATQVYGIVKADWKLLEVSSANERRSARMAFDGNGKTYWQSKDGSPHFISIDLGKEYTLKSFSYTPQNQHGEGMMAKGIIKISPDGKTWKEADQFQFGNLINDPVTRNHQFAKDINVRYIRIESTEIAAGSQSLAIAELDFFE